MDSIFIIRHGIIVELSVSLVSSYGEEMKNKLVAAGLVAMVVGCGSMPSDSAKQGHYYAESARTLLAKGELLGAMRDVTTAISRPGGADELRAAVASDPTVRKQLIAAIQQDIRFVGTGESAQREKELLTKVEAARLLSSEEVANLRGYFDSHLQAGNESGAIPFVMGEYISGLDALSSDKQMRIIYERTLVAYKDPNFTVRDMQALVEYVRRSGHDRALIDDFRKQLPALNVRSTELSQVALADPDFAVHRQARLSLNAHLSVENADRLFADDVKAQLSRDIHGVTWLPASQSGALELRIERVRDTEKSLPQQTQTITYSSSQVDLLSAALLMPRNASYQFDLKTGGAELDFGYVISAWRDGKKLSERVTRGKLGGEYKSCENPRIVNVFGGVTSAEFMANDSMKAMCSQQPPISIEAMRAQVLEKISDEVLAVPEVLEVHRMNL